MIVTNSIGQRGFVPHHHPLKAGKFPKEGFQKRIPRPIPIIPMKTTQNPR
jgi:hypothetical protein